MLRSRGGLEPIDANAWIDPEVQALAGISDEELERFKSPAGFTGDGGAVAQPGADAPGPHMTNYPEGRYEMIIGLPDEVVWENSENEPPVKVA